MYEGHEWEGKYYKAITSPKLTYTANQLKLWY